jgi:hypothetical protein
MLPLSNFTNPHKYPMKKLFAIALLLTAVGCTKKIDTTTQNAATDSVAAVPPAAVPSAMGGRTDVTNQKSSLIVTNSSYSLKPAHPVDSSFVELSCGCHFDFVIESFTGDTNAIKYKQFDAKTAQTYKVGLRFMGDPKAEKGAHEVKLGFLNTGSKGDYRDTITVKYTI